VAHFINIVVMFLFAIYLHSAYHCVYIRFGFLSCRGVGAGLQFIRLKNPCQIAVQVF